jgi:two-component system, LytTR family, response regulator
MMRTIIIDDEEKARKTIYNYLSLSCKEAEVVAQADSVESGYQAIVTFKPDLVLLDINLTDGTGFDLLKKFDRITFKIIFITAYEEYAIKAFKFSALDYLLKPVNPQELVEAIEKAGKTIENENVELRFKAFLTNYDNKPKTEKKLVLKTSENIFLVDIKDIIRCEADGGYTTFFLADGRKILVSKNLKEYEDILTEYNFFRPHHSHLVNLSYMLSFEKRDGGSIVMKDKSMVPVSTRRKDELMNIFENLK